MSSLYDQDQKKVQKLELHVSYTTCDEMIKIPPTERGLKLSGPVSHSVNEIIDLKIL